VLLMILSSRYAAANSCSGRLRSSMISVSFARCRNLDHTAENHRGVLGTKSDTVRQCVTDHSLAWRGWAVIEITFRISELEVQSRGDEILLEGKDDRADTGRAAGALRMTDHRLCRTHRNPIRTLLETPPDGTRLDLVIQLSRGSMKIYIVDVVDG